MPGQKIECVWKGAPAVMTIVRTAIRDADAWEILIIPEIETVVYIRITNEESTSGRNLLVCAQEDPPTNNPSYFTIWASGEKEWKIDEHGIPHYIAVQADTADRSYYYEFVRLKSRGEEE